MEGDSFGITCFFGNLEHFGNFENFGSGAFCFVVKLGQILKEDILVKDMLLRYIINLEYEYKIVRFFFFYVLRLSRMKISNTKGV